MPFCGKNKELRPVRQYLRPVNGELCRCAEFRMSVKDTPALLRWMEAQTAPVLGLRRSGTGMVTVYLGAEAKEEADG